MMNKKGMNMFQLYFFFKIIYAYFLIFFPLSS